MKELIGRTALVTGAGRGIGAAAARALAHAGARVMVTDLVAPVDLAAELGGVAWAQDVSCEQDWRDTMARIQAQNGRLEILINNAGMFMMKSLEDTTLDDWRKLHSVNVEGVFLGCKHAVPLLAESAGSWPGGAAIVNLSSVAGIVGSAGAACYNASKGAVRLFTKGLALELAPRGIRVNSLHPGVIDTSMGDAVMAGVASMLSIKADAARRQMALNHPLGRLGTADNIADAVVFLASDRAAFMTGAELVVDGGVTAR